MSIPFLNAAWKASLRSPSHRLVLVRLADKANAAGSAWPSLRELAATTSLSMRTVMRAVAFLEKEGFISVQRHQSPAGYKANSYQLSFEKLGVSPVVSCDTVSRPQTALSGDTLTPQRTVSGDTMSRSHVTSTTVSGDMVSKPPAPPYRNNHQEPTYEPEPLAVEEAISRIAEGSRELQTEAARDGIGKAIAAALRDGTSLEELERRLAARWKRYAKARDQGRFEIRGWGPAKFFADGHWRDEHAWPWRPEHRPSPPTKYLDLQARLNGSDYQRPAQLGVAS